MADEVSGETLAENGVAVADAGGPDTGSGADAEEGDDGAEEERDIPLENIAADEIPGQEAVEKAFACMAREHPEETERLKNRWGADAAANFAHARATYNHLATDEVRQVFENATYNGGRLGNHPALINVAAAIGRRIARIAGDPKSIKESGDMMMETDKEKLQGEIDEIHSWQYSNDPKEREKYRADKVQKHLSDLYERLVGTGPIVGQGGRVY